LSREEEAPLIEGARENRAPVMQEPHVMIEEETPQSDPEELERNIELWKQREAEASRKHMLALKKMTNQAEHELSQLYKEQWLQEELNVAVERNRQSCNALSSYQRVRVAGLSGDTRHEQRGTLGAPQESAPFWREQSVPLTEGQGILDQSEMRDPFDRVTHMVQVAIESSKDTDAEKSVLAKAGIKVAHPDSYSGGADLEEFEIFIAGVLQWLRMNSLLRPSSTEIQCQYLGTCLKGEAHKWFYRQLDKDTAAAVALSSSIVMDNPTLPDEVVESCPSPAPYDLDDHMDTDSLEQLCEELYGDPS
jgi:hypothetical protein